MKFGDPIGVSAFECLVFPVAGGVPLSAMATAGFEVRAPRGGNVCAKSKRLSRPKAILPVLMVLATLLGGADAGNSAHAASASVNAQPKTQIGVASWYGAREAGRRTASGTIFDPGQLTAAHRTLPLGTCVRVTDLANNRFVIVPVTDRGPYAPGRLIDLSESAAQALDMKTNGLAQVRVDVAPSCSKPASGRSRTHPQITQQRV